MSGVPGCPHLRQILVVRIPEGVCVRGWAREGAPAELVASQVNLLLTAGGAASASFGRPAEVEAVEVRSSEGVLVARRLTEQLAVGLWFEPDLAASDLQAQVTRVMDDLRRRTGARQLG